MGINLNSMADQWEMLYSKEVAVVEMSTGALELEPS